MSVIGFDFGNINSVVAITQRNGADIVTNEASNRKTPSIVSFGEKQRFVGDSASSQQITNFKNTVLHVKRLIGRKWSDPAFQNERPFIGSSLSCVELPNDRIGIEVMYKGEKKVFTPTQVVAMIFNQLKVMVEVAHKQPIADLMITVPGYFDQSQRMAILDAAKIAGLAPLGVVNDLTACAVNYGLFKLDISETDPRRVVIVDIGDTSTSAACIEFYKSKLKVIATSFDKDLGGRNITALLANYFADEFFQKHKIDIRSHPNSWRRMWNACDRLKPTLNTNPTAQLSVDYLHSEIDFTSTISREKYETMLKELSDRLIQPMTYVLEKAKIGKDNVDFVEVIGSGSRTKSFQTAISNFFGRNLSFTMNAEEAAARGCALVSAIYSPRFKVRQYEISDVVNEMVSIKWRTYGESNGKESFAKVILPNASYPVEKNITFTRSKPLEVDYVVGEGEHSIKVGHVVVPKLLKSEKDLEIKMKISLNISGLVTCESIDAIQEVEVEEEYKVLVEEDEEPEPTPEPEETMDLEESGEKPEEPKTEEKPKKKEPKYRTEKRLVKKTRHTPLNHSVLYAGALSPEEISQYSEVEKALVADVTLVNETSDAKNNLEGYIYYAKDKLYDVKDEDVDPATKEKFLKSLEEIQDWLYEDGEDETKAVYVARLNKLKTVGDVILKKPEPPVEEEPAPEENTENTTEGDMELD